MTNKWKKIITQTLGVNPICINSASVSAQNRERLFFTNIGLKLGGLFGELESIIEQPKDKKIFLKDILEQNVDEKYSLREKLINGFKNKQSEWSKCFKPHSETEKSHTITARIAKCSSSDPYILQKNHGFNKGNIFENKTPTLTSNSWDHNNHIVSGDYRGDEGFRWRKDNKTPTILARARQDIYGTPLVKSDTIRRLTPVEVCRLQTVDDNYFKDSDGNFLISESQIYKCLGNGFTIDVISHILSYL